MLSLLVVVVLALKLGQSLVLREIPGSIIDSYQKWIDRKKAESAIDAFIGGKQTSTSVNRENPLRFLQFLTDVLAEFLTGLSDKWLQKKPEKNLDTDKTPASTLSGLYKFIWGEEEGKEEREG